MPIRIKSIFQRGAEIEREREKKKRGKLALEREAALQYKGYEDCEGNASLS